MTGAQHVMVTAGLPQDGVVIDPEIGPRAIAARLGRSVISGLTVEISGADWVWPETLDALQPGDAAVVAAQLDQGRDARILVDGQPVRGTLHQADAPLVERAAAAARIDRMVALRDSTYAEDSDMRQPHQQRATALSLERRVLSPWTALLVFETEWDYARYGIARDNQAAVPRAGEAGLVVADGRRMDRDSLGSLGSLEDRHARAEPVDTRRRRIGNRGGRPVGAQRVFDAGAVGLEAAGEERDRPAAPSRRAASALSATPPPTSRPSDRTQRPWTHGTRPELSDRLDAEPPAAGHPVGAGGPPSVTRAPHAGAVAPEARTERASSRPSTRPYASRKIPPWSGSYAEFQARLRAGDSRAALQIAQGWRAEDPGEVLALLALGDALKAEADYGPAARAYGSVIALFPSRADLRMTAANHLEALAWDGSLGLAVDSYRKAVALRPDHPTGHRQLAFALVRRGESAAACDTILTAWNRRYRWVYERGIRSVLREDVATLAAVGLAREPARTHEIV